MSAKRTYSDEELLEDLRKIEKEVEGKLTMLDYNDKGKCSPITIKERFGSWNQGKEKAGLDITNRDSTLVDRNRDKIIEWLKEGLNKKEIAEKLDSGYTHLAHEIEKSDINILNQFTRTNHETNFLVSLTASDLESAGFDPDNTLYFKKKVQDGKIVLELRDCRVDIQD